MERDETLPLERLPKTEEDYTGVCPTCGRFDAVLNVGREHWVVCNQHMLKWSAGENLPYFICDSDTPFVWRRNARILDRYIEVLAGNGGCPELPFEVGWALNAVLDKLWENTALDYVNASPRHKDWHLYRHLYVLDRWINGKAYELPERENQITLYED